MRKRILNYVGFMIILSMVLTFVSASVIMYVKTNEWMEQDEMKRSTSVCF